MKIPKLRRTKIMGLRKENVENNISKEKKSFAHKGQVKQNTIRKYLVKDGGAKIEEGAKGPLKKGQNVENVNFHVTHVQEMKEKEIPRDQLRT